MSVDCDECGATIPRAFTQQVGNISVCPRCYRDLKANGYLDAIEQCELLSTDLLRKLCKAGMKE